MTRFGGFFYARRKPMAITTAISSQTTAAQSTSITLADGQSITVFCSPNLAPREEVRLQVSYDGGTSWVDVRDGKYDGVVLSNEVNTQTVTGPGVFRLDKEATATATTVYYES
jgi:hypothetical protein